ncbi:unnamed protein product [Spirodela intermedia]|uniref:Uncharacterized protein n=1 Tax=Spirodela intermedia TaxID=51605 RepID=A0A7I8KJU8_SPIIN|nr:unnamed protein product [Spirodela intermedia]
MYNHKFLSIFYIHHLPEES